jgi:hypothetical protein
MTLVMLPLIAAVVNISGSSSPAQFADPSPSPAIYQQVSPQSRDAGKRLNDDASNQHAPPESLSQLSLFLFGSGIAFFIALLAWSDQIRTINKDVRDLEDRFLEKTGFEKSTFMRIVKPKNPDDRGFAIFQVRNSSIAKSRSAPEALRIFTKWNKEWSSIELLTSAKYYLTILLTLVLFGSGTASLFTSPSTKTSVFSVEFPVERLLLLLPAILGAILIGVIVCIAARERTLRRIVDSVSEIV